jgi:hypothetical protein
MSEFVYVYRGGQRMPGSPEQAQQQMQKWMGWLKELTAKGHIKDPGHPLESTGKIVAGKPAVVTDGPFAEAKDMIGGYTVVNAADLTQAAELTTGCPIFDVGGTVEVRPIMQMG